MIEIDARGLEILERELRAMEARLQDLSPVLAGRAETLRSLVTDSFTTATSPWGEKWAPLSSATLRRRRGRNASPLLDTGKLRSSIATKVTKLSIVVASGDTPGKAAAHQFGTTRAGRSRRVSIPARPFLPTLKDKPRFDRGPAKAWYDRMVERVGNYVLTGKV